jgi:hypothetical protein
MDACASGCCRFHRRFAMDRDCTVGKARRGDPQAMQTRLATTLARFSLREFEADSTLLETIRQRHSSVHVQDECVHASVQLSGDDICVDVEPRNGISLRKVFAVSNFRS